MQKFGGCSWSSRKKAPTQSGGTWSNFARQALKLIRFTVVGNPGGGVLGVLAKFFWGGYLWLSENLGGHLLSCSISFLCDNFLDFTPLCTSMYFKHISKERQRQIWKVNKRQARNLRLVCTVGLFRVPRGQTNFYSKIYFLSKFQK